MSKDMTAQDWAAKASYEGGVVEAIFGYGLSSEDLLPSVDTDFREAVEKVDFLLKAARVHIERLEDLCESELEDFEEE